ncbi:MAG: hypothetical protein WB947_05045 [Thermoplasmata archaeon]
MAVRLHRGGKFRRWLGARLGGDFEKGDRVWRRTLHAIGAVVLVYYVLPTNFFLIAPKEYILLVALAAVLIVEGLRHAIGLQLPTIRPYEEGRVGSFAIFGTAIVIAILVFPLPIACAVILGTALVDPLAGELRRDPRHRGWDLMLPFVAYSALAFVGLAVMGRWPALPSVGLAVVAGAIGVAVERPKVWWYDDDFAMALVPAVVLYVLGVLALGLPGAIAI